LRNGATWFTSFVGSLYSHISDHPPVFYIDKIRCITHINPKYILDRQVPM